MAEDVVKSVGRVFEVLDLFSDSKQPLNATQVERRLNYPQSSTLALLKSLVKLGYLSFDRIERSYFPTIRIAHLGKWLETSLCGDAEITTLMEDVGARTEESVTLSCQNDLRMQILQIVPGGGPSGLDVTAGTSSLFQSATGIAALADQADGDIARLVSRSNRHADTATVELPALMARIVAARVTGHAVFTEPSAHGTGALAWPLAAGQGMGAVVVSVAGPWERIAAKADHIVAVVRAAFEAHLP